MRILYATLVVVVTALVLLFMLQNLGSVTVSFLTMSATMPLSILAILLYVLGMLTGSALFALLRAVLRGARKEPTL
jgi:uncharacterized integral membrane protein